MQQPHELVVDVTIQLAITMNGDGEVEGMRLLMPSAASGEDLLRRAIRDGARHLHSVPPRDGTLVAFRNDARNGHAPGAVAPRQLGELLVDPARHEAMVDDVVVPLTPIEFDILDVLTGSPHRVFPRREIIDLVWGPGWFGDERIIDAHMSKLRRKLGDDARQPRFIETVRGVGFRVADGNGRQAA